MTKNVIEQLNQIKANAFNHDESFEGLINSIIKICQPEFNIKKFYNEFGLITYRDALDLLKNNIIAAKRQHDLSDAEYFREQKSSLNSREPYFMETIHGCHIAPTVHPVTTQDIADMIEIIKNKIK